MEEIYKPWIEKYRPDNINNVILDKNNKQIINNIIKKKYFPNLLFYGPPGTGKTTTIINLIKEYCNHNNINSINNIIHLNASDERGIDVIRNQIYNFIHYKQIFNEKIKFIILDEVDYMTKSAQNSLKQLIKKYKNVRFCLICNYISKIIKPLQNMFLKLYFYNNNKDKIFSLLEIINQKEKLNLSQYTINILIQYYQTDIRSMINHLQIMQNSSNYNIDILSDDIYSEFKNIINNIRKYPDNLKKIQIIENKIKHFLYDNNIIFETLYIRYINEIKMFNLTDEIIENTKNLYYDSINNFDSKVKYFIYNILIPFYKIELN